MDPHSAQRAGEASEASTRLEAPAQRAEAASGADGWDEAEADDWPEPLPFTPQPPPAVPSGALRRRHALVCACFALGAYPFGERALFGVIAGCAIALVNLRGLERSVQRLLGGAQTPHPAALRIFLHLRIGLLFALVAVVLLRGGIAPIPFTIGLSSAVPAVLWHGWKSRYP